MERYISVDSGKFGVKIAEYHADKDKTSVFTFRSKVSDGDFRDDAIEAQTVVVEIDGKVYKVGNGARGTGAALETNKKSDLHKLTTLTALAMLASSNEKDVMNVTVELPAKDWAVVSKRIDYKEYMLPEGDVKIKIKRNSSSPIVEKVFTIKNSFAFPESIGALFMDETIAYSSNPTSITGVIDIGNLNLNATMWQGTELLQDKSMTAELGGAILIQELSQEISSNIVPCDELITANILKSKEGTLPTDLSLSDEQIENSKALISRVKKNHADKIKRCCNARGWSLDVTRVVAIGGTSKDIEEELKSTFTNIIVLPNSEYCNAVGCLRIMCSKLLGKLIPMPVENKKASEADDKKQKKAA